MAEQAKHTPWTARRDDSGGEPGLWSVVDANGGVVFFGMSEVEARLFAGAPDMLEALKALVPEDFDQHPQDFAPEWHKARAAVAKAEPRP